MRIQGRNFDQAFAQGVDTYQARLEFAEPQGKRVEIHFGTLDGPLNFDLLELHRLLPRRGVEIWPRVGRWRHALYARVIRCYHGREPQACEKSRAPESQVQTPVGTPRVPYNDDFHEFSSRDLSLSKPPNVPTLMKDPGAVSVHDVLSRSESNLTELAAKAKEIQACNFALSAALDDPLRSHLKIANIRGSQLVIQSDSPVWSARARLITARMLRFVNSRLQDSPLTDVQIITRPDQSEAPVRTSPRPRISIQTRRLLEDVARGIDSPALRRALLRLARRDV